jgi:hypothetical protein
MKRDKKVQQTKSDKKNKPETHAPVGKGIEKKILGERDRDKDGKAVQQRKLKGQ